MDLLRTVCKKERFMPDIPVPPIGEIIFYQTEDGRTRVECRFAEETLWLSQALMAELFQTTPQNITQHLQSLYADGEIEEPATCKEFLQVRIEGGRQVRRALGQRFAFDFLQTPSHDDALVFR